MVYGLEKIFRRLCIDKINDILSQVGTHTMEIFVNQVLFGKKGKLYEKNM